MNPYQKLDKRSFWSKAVARKKKEEISELWFPKFPIGKSTKIVTFGSCFAQHFSRSLVSRGFTWLNAEKAPQALPDEKSAIYNYGVFSARTANIYTSTLLLQWAKWALGEAQPPEVIWRSNGRYYDPFRPKIEPDGFASPEEVIVSRNTTIRAFKRAILESELFVFTLGLTESWRDSELHVEYPMCPGTAAGEFNPHVHIFENLDYTRVYESLHEFLDLVSHHRTDFRLMLTVSPVPLVATCSGNHVLLATQESKSILRAVAGNIAQHNEAVDYFPSYEIISSHPFEGVFFEPNKRGVRQIGVDHVMNQFFAGLTGGSQCGTTTPPSISDSLTEPDIDVVCEEELLEAFGEDQE